MNYDPYAAPGAALPTPGIHGVYGGSPRPWEATEVLQRAWEIFKAQWLKLVGLSFGYSIVAQTPSIIGNLVLGVLIAAQVIERDSMGDHLARLVLQVVSFVWSAYVQAGMIRAWLKIARGQEASFGDVFSGGNRLFSMLGTMSLTVLMVFFGLLACVVPGVILGLAFGFATYFVVDAEMGPITALKASWQVTKGQRLNIFVFWICAAGVFLLGLLACCVGLLASIPIVSIASALVYLRLTGRPEAM